MHLSRGNARLRVFTSTRTPRRQRFRVAKPFVGRWTSHVASFFDGAHSLPLHFHFAYLMLAGLGLPLSEDALVVWMGSTLSNGTSPYSCSRASTFLCLAVVYAGVVISDMITFYIGVGLRMGFFRRMRDALVRDRKSFDHAMAMVNKWGSLIGAIERFSLGFRGPLCIMCGYVGVRPLKFFWGVCAGALLTMPMQLICGHYLRNTANPYLAALAIVTGPNAVGHVLGPLLAGIGYHVALWGGRKKASK